MHYSLQKVKAFTLAELLIALAILGIIAVFTIPKVLVSQQDIACKSALRETFATLAQLTLQQSQSNRPFANATELKDYFRQNMNYYKLCSTNPDTEGCWYGGAGAANADGYVLHNGVYIMSFNGGSGTNFETLAIDCNGAAPPNTAGSDVIGVTLCFGPSSCSASIGGSGPKGPGTVGPSLGAINTTMWENNFAP